MTVLAALAACGGSSGPVQCSGACACVTDSDCSSGQTCVAGFCAAAQACTLSSDCSDLNATCVNGFCVDSTTGSSGSIGTTGTTVGTGTTSTSGHSSTGTTSTTGHAATTGMASTSGTTGHATTSTSSTSTAVGATTGVTSGATSSTAVGTTSGVTSGSTSGTTGSVSNCTSSAQCTGGQACVSGNCAACTADSQCGPPSLVCASGVCSQGCFPGTCPSGQLCDDITTGRCVPATGTTATGSTCTDGTDCVPQGQSSVAGVCVTLPSGSSAICSSLCEATDQCPAGMVCANFPDPVGFCLPASVAGATVGTSSMGQTCSGFSCDSVAPDSCDVFNANSGNDVCSDTCAGNGVGCIAGWSCITLALFYPDAGASCRSTGTCADTNSGCYSDGRCHQEILTNECVTPPTTGEGASGQGCEEDSDCDSNFCNGTTCVSPCCRSTDCPSGQACEALVGPSDSIVMGCVATTAAGGLGATCDTGTPTTCQSGFCVQNDPYDAGTAGYCADTCCSDAECGTGFACNLLSSTLPDGTTGLVPFCLKL